MHCFAIACLLISALAASHGHRYSWGHYIHKDGYRLCVFGRCYTTKSTTTPTPKTVACSNDTDCESVFADGFCDIYLEHCRKCKELDCQCRRDENCCGDRVCEWGWCREPKKSGTEGAACKSEIDCNEGLCCAEHYGRMICKRRGNMGQSCYEPDDDGKSVHSVCPCSEGLKCETNMYRYKYWFIHYYYRRRQCVKAPTPTPTEPELTTEPAEPEEPQGSADSSVTFLTDAPPDFEQDSLNRARKKKKN